MESFPRLNEVVGSCDGGIPSGLLPRLTSFKLRPWTGPPRAPATKEGTDAYDRRNRKREFSERGPGRNGSRLSCRSWRKPESKWSSRAAQVTPRASSTRSTAQRVPRWFPAAQRSSPAPIPSPRSARLAPTRRGQGRPGTHARRPDHHRRLRTADRTRMPTRRSRPKGSTSSRWR